MEKRLITSLFLLLCLGLGNISEADIITLYPTDDAYIDSDEPDAVHNGDYMHVGYNPEISRSYLMFDLSPIPPGQAITSAVLCLDTSYHSLPAPVVSAYYLENDSWSESTLTWNNAPTNFNLPATDTQSINIDVVFWTVTNDVNHAYGDDDIYSVVLKLSNEITGTASSFYSKDIVISDWSPYLSIQYQPVPEPSAVFFLSLGGLILRKRGAVSKCRFT